MKLGKIAKLILSLTACFLAAGIGSIFTISAIPTWYASLQKPGFAPPNWVFAPVWTLLYLLMGISLYIVWEKGFKAKGVRKAIGVFSFQLLLNALWSIAFFGLKSPLTGFLIIALLWASILATILAFYKIDKRAGMLLIPYIAWASIATALNYAIVLLNP